MCESAGAQLLKPSVPRKIPQLDGVRGIAILIVLAHNLHGFSSLPFSLLTTYGWMGVDLFFVLSGFLITGILLDAKSSPDYFRNFYARRCLRIWPLYYCVLALMFVVIPHVKPQVAGEIFHRSNPWWAYLFYLQNFLVREPASAVAALGVSWSLAVEELFYLVWPWLVRYLPVKRLEYCAWLVFLGSPFFRLFAVFHGWIIYSNPFCRLDGLMAGGLLAILVRKREFSADRYLCAAWAGLISAVPLAITSEMLHERWLTFSLATIGSAGLVYLAQYSGRRWLTVILTNRFLMFTGTISYGLYLLHKLPDDIFKSRGIAAAHPQLAFWSAVLCSYVIATASWYLFEKPILRLKKYFDNKPDPSGRGAMSFPKPSVAEA